MRKIKYEIIIPSGFNLIVKTNKSKLILSDKTIFFRKNNNVLL